MIAIPDPLGATVGDMVDRERAAARITLAFAGVEYPGDWCLRGSSEGDEPFLLEQEFKGRSDWRNLDPAFLDQAPGGFASAEFVSWLLAQRRPGAPR